MTEELALESGIMRDEPVAPSNELTAPGPVRDKHGKGVEVGDIVSVRFRVLAIDEVNKTLDISALNLPKLGGACDAAHVEKHER